MGSSEHQLQQQPLPLQSQPQPQPHDQLRQLYNSHGAKHSLQQTHILNNSHPRNEDASPTPPKVSRDDDNHSYSLSWKEFPTNFISFFKELREADELMDITLACEGKQISAHKVVLAACSPFFRRLLQSNPCQHPIVILNEVRYSDLSPLLHYMYHGEVHVHYDQITDFLRTAKLLQIRGLTGEETVKKKEDDEIKKEERENYIQEKEPRTKEEEIQKEIKEVLKEAPKTSPRSTSPENRRSSSPAAKRIRVASTPGSLSGSLACSPVSPSTRCEPTPPPYSFPMHPLPMHSLGLPLSLPSSLPSMPTLAPVTSLPSLPPYAPPPMPPNAHFPSGLFNMPDDAASDNSDDDKEDDDERDRENSLEKMSGLANMSAIKGLPGFPGPSGLLGLASSQSLSNHSDGGQG